MQHRVRPPGNYQTTTHLAVVLILLFVFLSAGYFLIMPVSEETAEQGKALAFAKSGLETWLEKRPVAFRYVVDPICSCSREDSEPFVATEERGYRTARFPIPIESTSGEFLESPRNPVWIDELFVLVRDSVLEGAIVSVAYDAQFGYPESIDIQWPQPDASMKYTIRDFEVIERKSR